MSLIKWATQPHKYMYCSLLPINFLKLIKVWVKCLLNCHEPLFDQCQTIYSKFLDKAASMEIGLNCSTVTDFVTLGCGLTTLNFQFLEPIQR